MKKKKFNRTKTKKVAGATGGKMKVYISKDIYRKIFKYAKNEKENQVGGILLGNIHADEESVHVIVRGFIKAKYAEINSGELTFTKETWRYIDKKMEEKSDMKVVGWMHTNPDKGCEPADYDVFFHSHFIKEKNTVEYIIDPVQMSESLYYFNEGQMKKIDGFFLYPGESESKEDAKEEVVTEETNVPEETVKESKEQVVTETAIKEETTEDVSDDDAEDIIDESAKEQMEELVAEHVEFKSEDIQSIFEKAEKSIQEDNSDIENNFAENVSIEPDEVQPQTSLFMKILVGVLSAIVVSLVVVVILLTVKITNLEKDMNTLFKNDEVIAKYINGVEDEH